MATNLRHGYGSVGRQTAVLALQIHGLAASRTRGPDAESSDGLSIGRPEGGLNPTCETVRTVTRVADARRPAKPRR